MRVFVALMSFNGIKFENPHVVIFGGPCTLCGDKLNSKMRVVDCVTPCVGCWHREFSLIPAPHHVCVKCGAKLIKDGLAEAPGEPCTVRMRVGREMTIETVTKLIVKRLTFCQLEEYAVGGLLKATE